MVSKLSGKKTLLKISLTQCNPESYAYVKSCLTLFVHGLKDVGFNSTFWSKIMKMWVILQLKQKQKNNNNKKKKNRVINSTAGWKGGACIVTYWHNQWIIVHLMNNEKSEQYIKSVAHSATAVLFLVCAILCTNMIIKNWVLAIRYFYGRSENR